MQSEIQNLKKEIETNTGCREVVKYRALVKKRGLGGFEFPKEPDYSMAQSLSEITKQQQVYLEALQQYRIYCNNPSISERLKEFRQEAIKKATKSRRSGGRGTRRKKGFQ